MFTFTTPSSSNIFLSVSQLFLLIILLIFLKFLFLSQFLKSLFPLLKWWYPPSLLLLCDNSNKDGDNNLQGHYVNNNNSSNKLRQKFLMSVSSFFFILPIFLVSKNCELEQFPTFCIYYSITRIFSVSAEILYFLQTLAVFIYLKLK